MAVLPPGITTDPPDDLKLNVLTKGRWGATVINIVELVATAAINSGADADDTVAVMDGEKVLGVSTPRELADRVFPPREPIAGTGTGIAAGSPTTSALPGPFRTDRLLRSCQYEQAGGLCGFTRRFAGKPRFRAMPACEDPHNFGVHRFVW